MEACQLRGQVILEKNGVVYSVLTQEYLKEVIEFVAEHFVKHEYLTRESGLTVEEFRVFAEKYCQASMSHHLSVIATLADCGRLVGFSINEDPNSGGAVDAEQFYAVAEGFKPFLGMLGELSENFLNIEHKPNNSFHLYLLGVHPNYQGQKIGKTLVKASEIHAKNNGFRYVVVEATSPLTKPICEHDGYTCLGNIPYKSFALNGKKPYAHILDYDGPYLFIKELSK